MKICLKTDCLKSLHLPSGKRSKAILIDFFCPVYSKSLSCFPPPSGQLIERVLLSSMLNPGEQWQTYRHHGRTLSLEYRLRFRCDSNYYGPFCNKFCRARDDFFGHFNCDPSGAKVCMEGWTGPECKEGEGGNFNLPIPYVM